MNKTIRITLEIILLAIVTILYARTAGLPVMEQEPNTQSGREKRASSEKANVVLLGHLARASGPVNIILKQPIDLKGKTKDEILNLREEQLLWQWDIFGDEPYQPVPAIMKDVDESKPWWGLSGQYIYDPSKPAAGDQNIQGLSEESRFLLNPLLLVGMTDIDAVTDILKVGDSNCNFDLKMEEKGSEFPSAYLGPKSLVWWPAQSRAEARYDVGPRQRDFLEGDYTPVSMEERKIIIYLTAYNAQDFGFHWAYMSLKNSQNVTHGNHSPEPFQLREFIHVGGSCGFPGGCNNTSPRMNELCCFRISHLPAKVQVLLWKDKPESADAQPDMVFDIWVE